MIFLVLLSFSLSIRTFEDSGLEPTPVPISVNTEMMEKSTAGCNSDIVCTTNDDVNPQCGQKCLGSSSNHFFKYTFTGERFQVYGSRQPGNGNFELYLNSQLIKTINLNKDPQELRTLIYESDILEYGEYTIECRGIGDQFEIYKFAFWPSVNAKRLNISDFQSSGTWATETDKIGGIRQYTNNKDAKKYTTIDGSRFWLYGSNDWGHGEMTIKINNEVHTVNQTSSTRADASLLYDTNDLQFKSYAISIENLKENNVILFYCLYYISDPPEQTLAPHPTRTHAPDTANDYINKQFTNTLEYGNINIPSTGSNIKQISGCTFTNIVVTGADFIITPKTEIVFYDNTFQYTDPSLTTFPVMWIVASKITFSDCTFKNFKDQTRANEGTVFSVNVNFQFTIERCNFINCGDGETKFMFKMNSYQSSLMAYGCTFSFDSVAHNCKICDFKFTDVLFDGCTFIRSGNGMISFSAPTSNGDFQFINNIVEHNTKTFILASNIQRKPVINGNIFRNIIAESEYLISFIHTVNEIELFNNTFAEITSYQSGKYGGGVALWFQNNNNPFSIILDQCKFYDNINNKNTSPYNQGGAIQYGYSTSISDIQMTFRDCEFKRNTCQNGMGGALGININRDLIITGCIFEDNQASTKGGAIYIWSKIVKPEDPPGAPEFTDFQMERINISNCQFIGNKGTSGPAIYIEEEENIGDVKLDISGCTFTNNGEDKSKYMIVSCCQEVSFENNKVEYLDESKTSGAIIFYNPEVVTITNSDFIKCMTATTSTLGFDEGTTKTTCTITITNSGFMNCLHNNNGYTISIPNCLSDFDNVTVSFDSSSKSNGGINFGNKGFSLRNSKIIRTKHADGGIKFIQSDSNTNSITISNCIFDNCENENQRCFQINKQASTTITFENNIIRNMIERGRSGYFGIINGNNRASTITITNLTLANNSCNSDYGGGSGLWIQNVGKLIFDRCNFINNTALSTTTSRIQRPSNKNYYPGDGGGIQYGFTASIYDIELHFTECLFRDNKATRHGGAIAVQMNNNVEIRECIFENNIANYQPSNSQLLYENYFDLKTEGRGGAIYINPTFTYTQKEQTYNGKTPSVTIEGCTFRSNRAYDGYAIYIEGEDAGTTFIINNNDFIDNYDPNSYSLNNSIITSEIPDLYEGNILTSNTFTFTDPNVYVPKLLYVDHYGAPPTPSSTPIKTGADISGSTTLNNINNLAFDCVLDRGFVKVYLTCNTCAIKNDLYFTVSFEDQEISKIVHDSRLMFPATNPTSSLDEFVLAEKIVLNKHNNSLSFDTGSPNIRYDRIDNNIKCYVPLTDVIFEDGDCTAEKRCEKIVDEPRPVHVFVEISQFTDFNKSTENGGAIHLVDCCLTCTNTPFTNCASKEGGGGAIYIKNELDYRNNITLIGLTFTECSAKYGGAVYIYSESFRVDVRISNCVFTRNHLFENNDLDLTGGSAVFLNARKSNMNGCRFFENYGSDAACRILTSFKSKSSKSIIRKTKSDVNSIVINECRFRADTDSKSLIHFIIGNRDTNIEVNKCIFTGVLKDGAHFIDEQILDSKSPLLKIKSCKFSYGIEKSLNLDPKHDPSLIDFNDLVFDYSEIDEPKQSKSPWKLVTIIAVPALAVVSIVVLIVVIIIKKKKSDGNSDDNTEITTNLIQDSSLL